MDFKIIREAFNDAPQPTTLPLLPREIVLRAHQQLLEREQDLDRRGEVRTRRMVIGPGKHWSRAQLDELKRVQLGPDGGMRCNEIAFGKVLVCRIVSKHCVRTVAAQIVVEDVKGRVASVHIYHLPARLTSNDLDELYPTNAIFALKEPNARESRDGYLLRVDSPPDLIRLFPSSPLLQNLSFPNTTSHPSPEQLKNQGNQFFSQKKWRSALDSYSLAIDLTSYDDPLFPFLLSNRAATYLQLKLPGLALSDSQEALEHRLVMSIPFRPLKIKALYRAASSAYQLQQFQQASQLLDELFYLNPDDSAAMALSRRTKLRLLEATTGVYGWPRIFEESKSTFSLDVADYIGSMLSVQELAGRGRGIVATRDIEPGELLLVSKPLAMGIGDPQRKSYVVGSNLFTETVDPYAANDVVALLMEQMMDDPSLRSKALDLHPGDDLKRFSINSALSTSSAGIDPSLLEGIATFNAFHTESLTQKTTTTSLAKEALDNIHAPSSLYHFPSYLNHSCLGNISYSFLSDIIFFRARMFIRQGEELVDSYVDSLEGYENRKSKLDKHGFVCGCELCEADKEDGRSRLSARERLAKELEVLTDKIHGENSINAADHIPEMEGFVKAIDATYNPSRGRLRPALYHALRLLSQTLASSGRGKDAIELEIQGLEALGAMFDKSSDEVGKFAMLEVPKVGDVNSVLSSLFIAKQLQLLEDFPGSKNWVEIARRTERGQAGEELFKARYSEWAAKNGVTL